MLPKEWPGSLLLQPRFCFYSSINKSAQRGVRELNNASGKSKETNMFLNVTNTDISQTFASKIFLFYNKKVPESVINIDFHFPKTVISPAHGGYEATSE